MDTDQLKARFKAQFVEVIDKYAASVPDRHAPDVVQCAMAAGMLILLSAMKAKDGPNLGLQVVIMHAALREIGDERGWVVTKNGAV